jgi:predicted DNA-binding protein (UPF0251 family)
VATSPSASFQQLHSNTQHNASFINIDPTASPVTRKPVDRGVSFRDQNSDVDRRSLNNRESQDLGDYYDSYGDSSSQNGPPMPNFKPNFGSRGSSLKNLEHAAQKMGNDPRATMPPMPLQSPSTSMPVSRESSIESRHFEHAPGNQSGYPPRKASREEFVYQRENLSSGNVSPFPQRRSSREDFGYQMSSGSQSPFAPRRSSREDFGFQRDFSFDNHRASYSQSEASVDDNQKDFYERTRIIDTKSSLPPVQEAATNSAAVQTESNHEEVESLYEELEELRKRLETAEKEKEELATKMAEQKRGFDKLSAQAYKKIKELLTERNIMSIEMTSLKAQVLMHLFSWTKWKINIKIGLQTKPSNKYHCINRQNSCSKLNFLYLL